MITELAFLPPMIAISIWISIVDYKHFIIPDPAIIMLFLLGLVRAILLGPYELPLMLLGSLVGAATLFAFRRIYHQFKAVHGLGLGDVKLMAAIGMWIKPLDLPLMLLLSCLAALSHVLIMGMLGKTVDRMTRLPFGPYLCFGLAVLWITDVVMQ